jgi:hypothetical protein
MNISSYFKKSHVSFSFFFLILLFCANSPLQGMPHQINLGPEVFSLERMREGGTKQSGTMYGIRGTYDSIGRYLIYCGLEGAYSQGVLTGKTGSGSPIKSHFTEECIEGRLGYTFQSKNKKLMSFTPFLGVGYFKELNHYVSPSLVKVHFDNRFSYAAYGCLLRGFFTPTFSFGLNVTARWSLNGKVKISHDPNFDVTSVKYTQKMQARVSMPFWYNLKCTPFPVEICFSPFFEYRQYGKKIAVPFDFLDTRIRSWGASLFYSIRF